MAKIESAVVRAMGSVETKLTVLGREEIAPSYLRLEMDDGGLLARRAPHPTMWLRLWFAEGGRDHWPDCYSVLLAGGGVAGGAVYGSSDRVGAYPAGDPVTPGDLAATIFWRFGLDPATEVRDQTGRPHRLATGEPLRRLFGR